MTLTHARAGSRINRLRRPNPHHRSGLHRIPRVTVFLLALALLPLAVATQPVSAASTSSVTDPRLQQAVVWAKQQMYGRKLWIEDGDTLCGKFVENAFGVSGLYPTAYDMYRALGQSSDASRHTLAGLQRAPAGAIVFFAPNARNGYSGHVGLYVGGGQFIGIGSGGHVRQYGVQWWSGAMAKFIGWAYPPPNWPGISKAGTTK